MNNDVEVSEFVKKIKDGTIPFIISNKPTRGKYDKYGSIKEFDKLVDSKKVSDRVKAAKMGYGLEKLMDDDNQRVLKAVWDYLKPTKRIE